MLIECFWICIYSLPIVLFATLGFVALYHKYIAQPRLNKLQSKLTELQIAEMESKKFNPNKYEKILIFSKSIHASGCKSQPSISISPNGQGIRIFYSGEIAINGEKANCNSLSSALLESFKKFKENDYVLEQENGFETFSNSNAVKSIQRTVGNTWVVKSDLTSRYNDNELKENFFKTFKEHGIDLK